MEKKSSQHEKWMQIQFEKKCFKMAEDIRQLLMLIELLKAQIKLNFISDKD